ncbi:MAG: HD domain-containing protein [Bdellovibrionales bacterium]
MFKPHKLPPKNIQGQESATWQYEVSTEARKLAFNISQQVMTVMNGYMKDGLNDAIMPIARLDGYRKFSQALNNEPLLLTILAAQSLMEKHDVGTARHQLQAAALSTLFRTGLAKHPRREALDFFAAVCHDVGKLAVSSDTLNNPHQLTAEAQREIKLHPEVGYAVLQMAKDHFFKNAKVYSVNPHILTDFDYIAKVALMHHVDVDGKGYPTSIDPKQTDPVVLETAAADKLDAIHYRDTYTRAKSDKVTIEIFMKMAGASMPILYAKAAIDLIKSGEAATLINSIKGIYENRSVYLAVC